MGVRMLCDHCGGLFVSVRYNQTYCSLRCRQAASRLRHSQVDRSSRACELCGTSFTPLDRGTPGMFCSRRCTALSGMRRRRGIIVTEMVERECWWCGVVFQDVDMRRKYCSAACRQLVKHLVDAPNLIDGWSATMYRDVWRAQGGKCKICRRPPSGRNNLLCRDHDHTTGQPRGLLCDSCNRAIGLLGDSLERVQNAADYLQHYHPELLRKGGAV